jgi:hypothetical protein
MFELTEASLIPILSLIGTVLLIAWNVYKWVTGEKKGVESDSAGDISSAAAVLIKPLKDEITDVRTKNAQLEAMIVNNNKDWEERFNKLNTEYIQMQSELLLFKDWAQRLVYQIQSLGETPVPMIKKDYSEIKKNGK